MRRGWIWVSTVGVLALSGLGWMAYRQAERVAVEHVAMTVLNDPSVQRRVSALLQQEMEKTSLPGGAVPRARKASNPTVPGALPASTDGANGSEYGSSAARQQPRSQSATTSSMHDLEPASINQSGPTAAGPPLVFHSRQQAIDFIMSRFTQAELMEYARLYAERSKLSPAEKERIKQEILSHFTPQEIAALEAVLG